ncbi:helix-turn-helix domain-containing protein [Pusillimonas noertemannii]|uniref:helix-turn-helix domain-containing protein n=1 Tax=Pusillimonas noertemannii TaxID=305977 RepID=UPI0002F51F12|nr:helix-turn-helix domain-containing protein [Pusillimonas noertemannii]
MNAYDTVNPSDGFERWHHATCRNYSHTEAQSISEPGFSASVAVHRFGRLAISRNSSLVPGAGQWRVTRGPSDIRRDHRDDFFLWIGRGGTVVLEQQGRAVALQAGDLMLMDQARPFSLTFGQTSAYTIVIVPRELMQSHLAGAQDMVARGIDGRSPLARLGSSLADECMALSASDDTWPQAPIDTAALDIWSSAIGSALTWPDTRAERRGQRLAQVKTFMTNRLDDADLDVASIARETYMSSRTLLRLFAAEGTTPMRWLWAERLSASRHALEQGRFLRVTDAAVAFGFKDLSHYSRVFKAAYGHSPQQVLKSRVP